MSEDVTLPAPSAARGAPVVSICVISYNTCEMTLDCLRSVQSETGTPHEIIVVDNASDDGSADRIREAFPDVRLIAETENHGFARAHDIAVPAASGDYILLLNPDTVILDGAIDTLVAFAGRRPEARIWGGRTLYGDRSLNPTSCWRRQTLWSLICAASGLSSLFPHSGLFNPEAYGGWKRDTEREVDIVTGCFLLIERPFWQELGGFDPVFFMYGEEADLCLRARARGARPRITPEAEIIHYGGVSERVRADKMIRIMRAKISLASRHFPPLAKPVGLALLRLWPWSRMIATGTAARLGIGRIAGHAESWREVWHRRAEWWSGYAEIDEAPTTVSG